MFIYIHVVSNSKEKNKRNEETNGLRYLTKPLFKSDSLKILDVSNILGYFILRAYWQGLMLH
jgi:hypothetical protein